MAESEADKFSKFFLKIRKMFPTEVTEACLRYLAQKGLDDAGRSMAFWLVLDGKCFRTLFEASDLQSDVVFKATAALRKADPQFPTKFVREAEQLTVPVKILRALYLAPAIGDYSALLPWMKKLTLHSDEHVRSRAVKLVCEIRPSKSQIDRQMMDENARVRANAIEALWNVNTPEAIEIFKTATTDGNHRVVINALIGLHLQGSAAAFGQMVDLCQSPQIPFRMAIAWCLGFIRDERGIASLQTLSKDASPIVRKRALRSLLALQPADQLCSSRA
jgi:hypothetical protein